MSDDRRQAWHVGTDFTVAAGLPGREDRRRIVLQYDIELEVADFRADTLEYSLSDYYGGYDLSQEPQGIISQTHRNTYEACQGKEFGDRKFSAAQRLLNASWLETRLLNLNLHCSVSVNFRQRDGVYRLSEFMLAGKSQSARPWNLTPCRFFNAYAVDGGGGYELAWYRTSIELLRDERFLQADPSLGPVLLEGSPFREVPDGGLPLDPLAGPDRLDPLLCPRAQERVFSGPEVPGGQELDRF